MKIRTAKLLLNGSKVVRLLYLPAVTAGVEGRGVPSPAGATPQALPQGEAAVTSLPLGDAAAVKESFLDKALDAYAVAYRELAANWRSLEVKAQGNITIAGIFIAASFAFLQKIQPELRFVEKLLLGVGLFCLVVSVLLAVRVLLVKSVPAPIFGDMVARAATSLYAASEGAQFPKSVMGRYQAYFEEWQKVIDATQELISDKAERLSQAQEFLQVAIVIVAILAAARVVV
ncbi:MAG: hypothetical protein JOZ96_10555 [Acidobacteria bacterium]|nr:hypothetical protein [Acidobacteriota bacterium]